jgi:hypothetical protein
VADWQVLNGSGVGGLVEARLQLHHAAQVIVSAPMSYLPARADDSHTNLEWLPGLGALATHAIDQPSGLRFAVRPADLSLIVLRAGAVAAVLTLAARTTVEAAAWLAAELRRAGFDPTRLTMQKHYEIPAHPVASGAPFDPPAAALAELARWYHDTWLVADGVSVAEPGASPARCWPHHFDLATLITLAATGDGVTRTIGVGGSPGDD